MMKVDKHKELNLKFEILDLKIKFLGKLSYLTQYNLHIFVIIMCFAKFEL